MMRENSDNRLLLAAGVFDTRPPFESALADLHGEGFGAREMCLLGTPAAFASMVKRPARPLIPRSGKPLHQRQRHQLPWLLDELDLRATSGILLRTLTAQAAAEHDKLVVPSACFIDDLGAKLGPHLAQDAIALLVNAADHTHQNQGARVLLRHSLHPVHTYAVRAAFTAEQ